MKNIEKSNSLLSNIYNKHSIWIEIVQSFGVNKDTSEDIVMEMYIKIKRKLDEGLNIDFGDEDYNYYYIFKTLKTMYWYDRKVFDIIDKGTSVASLSRRTKIPYHSLYNTYRRVMEILKKKLI